MSNMNEYEIKRKQLLEEKWYSEDLFNAVRRNIRKNVTQEDATTLGKKLLELISTKGYSDLDNDGQIAEATQLIFAGANLETKDEKNGDTSLIVCSKKGLYVTFSLLVRSGADIDAQNNFLSTATMWSARKGFKNILDDLILLQADINARCQDGDTALHSAVKHYQIESVNSLIQAGIILNAQNNLGHDGLKIADNNGFTEISNLISSSLDLTYSIPVCTEDIVKEELESAKARLLKLKR